MGRINLLLLAVIYAFCLHAQETEWEVSGSVTSQSGEVLAGVNVAINGTNRKTVSDSGGRYTLMVPEYSVLHFSYTGYKSREIALGYRSVIDVVMEDLVKEQAEIVRQDIKRESEPEKKISVKGAVTSVQWPITERVDTENNTVQGIKPAVSIGLSWEQVDKASADNGFGFRMFGEVSKLQGTNTFFSPLSLHMAIGMLYNGASDLIRKEMDKVLGIRNFSVSELNDYYRTISLGFLQVDPTTEIAMANAIWYKNKFQVKEDFIETLDRYFDAEVAGLDFNDPKAAGIINDWCRNKMNGRIDKIVDSPLRGDMILTNALYFKSKWEKDKKFDKKDTRPDEFTKSDKTKSRVNMMEQTTSLRYYADEYLQSVELPYGNRAFSMIAILPPENRTIDQLIDYLRDGGEWNPIGPIVKGMKHHEVWLKMPRFKIECELPLNQPLKNVGMGLIFKGGFSKMADTDMAVNDILQKTFVEVNEEGTEAVAVTKVSMTAGAVIMPSGPVTFFANRPFLFIIREKSTGVILFIGRIDDPEE